MILRRSTLFVLELAFRSSHAVILTADNLARRVRSEYCKENEVSSDVQRRLGLLAEP